jgi:hypothetical protein
VPIEEEEEEVGRNVTHSVVNGKAGSNTAFH